MNSCVLMATVATKPELRYTQDSQIAISQMLVEFPALKPEEPPHTIKVVGWGNLATEIEQKYHPGDQVIIEGRLNINTVERPEGFKEKKAELTVSRIFAISGDSKISATNTTYSSNRQDNVVAFDSFQSESPAKPNLQVVSTPSVKTTSSPASFVDEVDDSEHNLDDIPF